MLNDFEFSRRRVTVRVDALDGGTLDDVIQAGSPECEVKTVIDCGIYDDNWNVAPVEWTTVSESLERQRQVKPGFGPRYPTDGSATTVDGFDNGSRRIAFCGNDIWCVPTGTQGDFFDLELEAYTFQPDWTATSDSAVVSGVLGGAAMNGSYWPYGIFNQRPLYLNFLDSNPVAMDAIWYLPGEWRITPVADIGKVTLSNYQSMVATTMGPGGTYTGHGTFSGQGIVTMAPGSDTTDIWLRQGSQYLLWAAIVQINHLCKEFVFRQEGNLPPPEKLRDDALETFKQWDSFKYEQDRRHVY